MLALDGSEGEGGGQILRSSLCLSLVTGQPFRIDRIRARRQKPGLMRQHLAAIEAAAAVGNATVSGATQGSQSLVFEPRAVRGGTYRFAVGTAGSATLVLQTVLPALVTAADPSSLVLEGGTHNPLSPPFDFLQRAYLPLLERMGPRVGAGLDRPGFYPAGGGRFRVTITPAAALAPLELVERGALVARRARALVSRLPRDIAERELAVLTERLSLSPAEQRIEEIRDAHGPGNVVLLELESEHVTEVVVGFGERGVRAETVAARVADEAATYLSAGVPVGEHLADQLVLLLALARGGVVRTLAPSLHTRTQLLVIERFLGSAPTLTEESTGQWRIAAG